MKVSDSSSCFSDAKFFPPGFRFHPTDEELVLYYLKRKICGKRLKLDIVAETDVYKWDPEDLPGLSKLRTGDRQWFFFSHRDRKYPNGARSNRATMHGYWKATGKDRTIACNSRSVGNKKTLVFYKGRAPSGERTDWVMHEYTLDEEELKRCQFVKNYYALYKVFKKSGPGPKNGEQYGAPFKEEEWADDDECFDFNGLVDRENIKDVNGVCFNNIKDDGQQQSLLNDLEELLNRDEFELIPSLAFDNNYALDQLVGEEETQSTLVDQSSRGVHLGDQVQYNVQGSIDLTQSTGSHLQLYEGPEVTSAPNIYGQEPLVVEEDFLEMDDLIGPEPTVQNCEKPVESFQLDELDGSSEFDQYYDVDAFLREQPLEPEQISQPYMNNLENGMSNLVSNIDNGPLNHQVQLYPDDANQAGYQMWTDDQQWASALAEPNQMANPPLNSGVTYDGNSINRQGNEDNNGRNSWFTSALWGFVDSIPTTPASASEGTLVNKAFERMSSFGRVRMNAISTSSHPSSGNTAKGGSMCVLLCFSILGVLCAILWMLIGTSAGVSGRYISS
ncbi:hypothetical protein LguiA_018415 [Lonicera macranthoides]